MLSTSEVGPILALIAPSPLILMNTIIFQNIKYGFMIEFVYLNVILGKKQQYISELLIINCENSFK
jgi:hypothetical protein